MREKIRGRVQNKGFVLLSVMFAVTLLLTSAVAFAWFVRVQLLRVSAEDFAFRSRCAAREACVYASQKINEDNNGYDSFSETLYSPNGGISMEFGGFKIDVKIKPLDDRISARGIFLPDGNTLRAEYEQAWKTVWAEVGCPELAQKALDFMDADSEQKLGSVEKQNYLNRPIYALSELKLLDGVDDALLYGTKKNKGKKYLAQFISALGSDKINVNSANAETLAVLDSSIGYGTAASFVDARKNAPVKKISDLKSYPGFSAAVLTRLSNVLSTESGCFELSIKVAEGALSRNYRAVVQRGKDTGLLRWEE
ncbi:MAG: type II secretion system protein GspK [Synergistaceae bacterium]|nr:type II secretion system protein GspK [Synergistaceae bacterium]